MKSVIDETPFDVLWCAEMRFDAAAQLHELHNLLIGQRRLLLLLRRDRSLPRSAFNRRVDRELFGGDRLFDDCFTSHLVDVRVHQARHERFAESKAGLDRRDLPIAGDWVGREENTSRM